MRLLIKVFFPIYKSLPLSIRRIIWTIFNKIKTKHGKIIHTTESGITYNLDRGELIDNSIYYLGYFEKDTTSAIKNIVKKGWTVVDIGANIGVHTLLMAKLVGDGGRVIAFEPMISGEQI